MEDGFTHKFCGRPKLSNDKQFVEKLEDVVGLYLNPPENAIVLSCDEKSQMQALDRTQPGLPLKKGRCGTLTHDYKRNGTTTMFAALNTLDGSIIGTCMPKHRHQEWIRFLNQIKRSVPKDKQIHIICDNYATHKHQKVVNWLKRNTRFHVHFTPTSASWLNMVERFFRDLSEQRLRRGVFHSVPELIQAVEEYVGGHNQNPKPFIWTTTASCCGHSQSWRIGHISRRILIEVHTSRADQNYITIAEFDALLVDSIDEIVTGHSIAVRQHIDAFSRRNINQDTTSDDRWNVFGTRHFPTPITEVFVGTETVPDLTVQSKVVKGINVGTHVRVHRDCGTGVTHVLVHRPAKRERIVVDRAVRRVGHPDAVVWITGGLPARHANEVFNR